MSDSERKMIRILYNYFSQQRQMPGWVELTRKMGKDKQQVTDLLNGMSERSMIEWNGEDPKSIVMMQRPESFRKPSIPTKTAADYFTEY